MYVCMYTYSLFKKALLRQQRLFLLKYNLTDFRMRGEGMTQYVFSRLNNVSCHERQESFTIHVYGLGLFFLNISNHIHVITVGMTPLPLYLLNIKKIACHQSKLGFVHTYEFNYTPIQSSHHVLTHEFQNFCNICLIARHMLRAPKQNGKF